MVSVIVEMGGYDRSGLMGAVARAPAAPPPRQRAVPDAWTFIHVADRTEEAADIMRRIPANIWPKGYGNGMPQYTYDFEDLVAQAETLELDRAAKERNRVRIPASPDAIARMNQALTWPMTYLTGQPELARAVWAAAHIAASKVPDRFIQDAIDGVYLSSAARTPDTVIPGRREFYRMRMQGLLAISQGLTRDRVPVT